MFQWAAYEPHDSITTSYAEHGSPARPSTRPGSGQPQMGRRRRGSHGRDGRTATPSRITDEVVQLAIGVRAALELFRLDHGRTAFTRRYASSEWIRTRRQGRWRGSYETKASPGSSRRRSRGSPIAGSSLRPKRMLAARRDRIRVHCRTQVHDLPAHRRYSRLAVASHVSWGETTDVEIHKLSPMSLIHHRFHIATPRHLTTF